MITTIDLPNEVYQRLERQAQMRGVTIVETVAQVLAEAEANRLDTALEQMRAEGVLLTKKALPPDYQRVYRRIEVTGAPVSECLVKERR
ncbi:MAG: hypothetical protein HOP19_04240 [Acidobacteria bacterium]|nr:hypothetical protein [Acidobacteriota bacterium]